MRVGRIILALLAPLVSLPAMAAGGSQDQLPPQAQTPAVDSLLRLLRSVVPVAITATDSEDQAVAHADRAAWPVMATSQIPATASPAVEAALHLLLRQQHRSLLRC